MKTLQIYLADLHEVLSARDFVSARTLLKVISAIDLADGWEHFTQDERVAILRLCTRQKAMQLFEELDPPEQAELLQALQRKDAQELLSDLDPAATGRMMRELPQPLVRQLTSIMNKGGKETVQQYLQYPAQTVGALMRGRYVTLDEKMPVRQAVERVQYSTRLRRIEETHLDTLMVVDGKNRLRGVLGLKSLVVAPRDMTIGELMDPAPRTLAPGMDQEEAVKLFTKYRLKSAPVVSPDLTLLGVVVYRDIFEIASEETEEDFAKMAGYGRAVGVRTSLQGAMLRLPWLVITCLGGVGVSWVVTHFEPTLSKVIALAAFSPLIAGMGGNVGSQTATIVVRGLATGEISDDRAAQTVAREIGVGVLLGLIYGSVVGGLAGLMFHERHGWEFGVVVGLAMGLSMVMSATLAATVPLALRRAGVDPATAAGPMITTSTDLLSNAFYFSLATWLLLN